MKRFFTRIAFVGALLTMGSTQAQILSEDFEGTTGNALPSGWTQTNATSGSNSWKSGTGAGLSSTYFPITDHTRIVAINDDGAGNGFNNSNEALITPSFSLVGATNPYLKLDLYYYKLSNNGVFESLIIKYSIDGGGSWINLQTMDVSPAWVTQYISLAAIGSQANVQLAFVYSDNGEWNYGAAIDNVVVYVPSAVDVALTAVTPAAGDPTSYGAVGSNMTFGGTIFNQGTSPITSGTITYSVDGGSGVVYNLASVNVAPFTSYDFSIPTPYTLTAGNHDVDITIDFTGDAVTTDNTLSTTVVGAQFIPDHVITFEEGTGTWCGWCPRGAVFMDSIHYLHDNDVVTIAVHNSSSDPMTLTAYDNGVSSMIGGYPSVLVDRKVEVDPSDMLVAYDDYLDDFGFANLTTTKTYNTSTRALTVDVSAHFAVDLAGDYRLALVLTENGVHGTSSGYAQTNYYSFQSQDIELDGAGHDWQSEPNPVAAAGMYYNFVARYISGGFTGQNGSLPGTIAAGSIQTHTFNTTLNAAWVDWNMQAHVLLIDATNNVVLNAVDVSGAINGVNDVNSAIDNLSLYPNPAENVLNVLFSLTSQKDVTIELTDVIGKTVGVYNYNNVAAGTNQVVLNTTTLANGVYFANIKTDGGMISRKFVKQ